MNTSTNLPSPCIWPDRPNLSRANSAAFIPTRGPSAAPRPTTTISLRGHLLTRFADRFPARVLNRADSSPDRYVDISLQDFDLYEDVYRHERVSPRYTDEQVNRLRDVARYLDDKNLKHDIQKILPLRRIAHESKGTQDHPSHLITLGTALHVAGQAEASARKINRALSMLEQSQQPTAINHLDRAPPSPKGAPAPVPSSLGPQRPAEKILAFSQVLDIWYKHANEEKKSDLTSD